ncbi:hypothetical protein [Nocardioides nanhaiensis]|uniref:Bacterial Ig-like domain-containing protein n=1 Tax=Nocardioides nanhaiensis TaxID=1476871 RepID=A0ABP8WMF7_9ACTN
MSGRSGPSAVAVGAVGIVLALVVAALPAQARSGARATPPDQPWSGYLIDTGARASDTFIGARRLQGRADQVVYRIDPAADVRPGGFGPFRRLARLGGGGQRASATPQATARAAWVVGKYGDFRYAVQNAAVDAALLHLLVGGRYRLTGAAGQERIRDTGFGPEVRRFAQMMVADSAREAGPYRLSGSQSARAAVGQAVPVRLALGVARSGRGVAELPLQVRSPGGGWRTLGTTDDAGRLAGGVPGLAAGPHQVQVRAVRVPDTRVRVASPDRSGGSRVVLAGRKTSLVARVGLAVQARPRVGMRTPNVRRGAATRPVLGLVAGYGTAPRRAKATLHGPFPTARAASCGRLGGRTLRATVSENGTTTLASVTLLRAGYYTWRASLSGNRYNLPATACTGAFRVRR